MDIPLTITFILGSIFIVNPSNFRLFLLQGMRLYKPKKFYLMSCC